MSSPSPKEYSALKSSNLSCQRWSALLLESLLRKKMLEAETREMVNWYMDLLDQIEQEADFQLDFFSQEEIAADGLTQRAALKALAIIRKTVSRLEA